MSASDLWATAMGRWCDDLGDLMLPFERISLTRADLMCIGGATPGFAATMEDPCPVVLSDALQGDLATVMAQFPQGAHLRMDLCSLKSAQGLPQAMGADHAGALLLQPNPRVAGLIWRGLQEGEAQSLFVFPWRMIPAWSEFRIFIRGGQMVGITQADASRGYPEIARHAGLLEPALMGFVATILPRLPLRDVVIDVFADVTAAGCKVWLVELNPFVQRTDPGLYTWDFGGDFDGRFRYHGQQTASAPAAQPALADHDDIDIWRI